MLQLKTYRARNERQRGEDRLKNWCIADGMVSEEAIYKESRKVKPREKEAWGILWKSRWVEEWVRDSHKHSPVAQEAEVGGAGTLAARTPPPPVPPTEGWPNHPPVTTPEARMRRKATREKKKKKKKIHRQSKDLEWESD